MLTRFAPSPTGYLHIGNMRTALLCFLYARKEGGKFLLRFDDTDTERSKPEYVKAIREDLQWLGLKRDEEIFQSRRFARYEAAVEKLKSVGRVYACYETPAELEIKRKMQLARGKPPIYDREGLRLTEQQKQKREAEGRKPHWRFKLDAGAIEWRDQIHGECRFEGANLSDPIVLRENGMYTYMLPSTVDDMELGVTHVLRGEDHIPNTAIQIQIFKALGSAIPVFAHNAFIKTKEGKLSKRTGASSVRELKELGIEPMAVNSFLAKIGTSGPVEPHTSLSQLVQAFGIEKFSRSATLYSMEDIERLNAKLLQILPFDEVKARLAEHELAGVDAPFWEAVRGNITRLAEVKDWWRICREEVTPAAKDNEFLRQAAELLPHGQWDESTWQAWIEAVKIKTGRKGKELFMPVRLALTGMDHGPELKVLLPLIGRERAAKRLKGAKE